MIITYKMIVKVLAKK